MADPSAIASTNASMTRASVAPRCRNSAPDSASFVMVASTAEGGGSFVSPMVSAAIHQTTRNSTKDRSRNTSLSQRAIEGAGLELRRRPDQVASADLGEHAIEHAR